MYTMSCKLVKNISRSRKAAKKIEKYVLLKIQKGIKYRKKLIDMLEHDCESIGHKNCKKGHNQMKSLSASPEAKIYNILQAYFSKHGSKRSTCVQKYLHLFCNLLISEYILGQSIMKYSKLQNQSHEGPLLL